MEGLGVTLGPVPMMQAEIDAGRLIAPLAGPLATVRGYCWVVPRLLMDEPAIGAFCAWLETAH